MGRTKHPHEKSPERNIQVPRQQGQSQPFWRLMDMRVNDKLPKYNSTLFMKIYLPSSPSCCPWIARKSWKSAKRTKTFPLAMTYLAMNKVILLQKPCFWSVENKLKFIGYDNNYQSALHKNVYWLDFFK